VIRFGVCAGFDKLQDVVKIGFDYIEMSLTTVAALSQQEFDQYKAAFDKCPIKSEAYNGFVPGDIKLTGPAVDNGRIDDFLEMSLSRAQALGGKVVVFGSSAARNLPEDWTEQQAWPQLVDFCHKAGDVASKKGITIVIEPLRKAESNILNLVREGYRLAKEVNHPHVKLLADTYHMAVEYEGIDALADCADMLYHVHTANPVGRVCPAPGDGIDYVGILGMLQRSGYNHRFSIECGIQDFVPQLTAALAMFRSIVS